MKRDVTTSPDLASIRARLGAHEPKVLDGEPRAAVAAILRPQADDVEIMLIRRAERAGDPWSGHMAFPGGRVDPADPDALYTACRETREEVGIDLRTEGALLGRLDDIPAIARGRWTGIWITPFVFELSGEGQVVPNHEVDEVLWASVTRLLSGAGDTVRPYEHEGVWVDLPAFEVEGRIVWGLTYQMLSLLFSVLGGGARG